MNKITKVISTQEDAEIRRLIKVLGLGTDDVQEVFQAAPYGDDSNPIKNMVAVMSETNDSGESVIVGYINKNQIAKAGEKRIFSTDSNGNVKMSLYLKNDGNAEFGGNSDNLVRFSPLDSGYLALRSDLNAFISVFNAHIHPFIGLAVGVPGATTPTATPGAPSSASISGAKIDEIKSL